MCLTVGVELLQKRCTPESYLRGANRTRGTVEAADHQIIGQAAFSCKPLVPLAYRGYHDLGQGPGVDCEYPRVLGAK